MNDLNLSLKTVIPNFSSVLSPQDPEGFSALVVTLLIVIFTIGVLYALTEYFACTKKISLLEKLVDGAERETLAERRRELRSRAQSETKSGKLWREFDESLVMVESRSRLFNTIDAPHFFNTHTLARGLTENRLVAAMPGILTAIGVIGTFAGLQMGLAALSASVATPDQAALVDEVGALKAGIFSMIGGASIAFMTSLWGVFLSVVFNFLEKLLERGCRGRITSLQNTIDYLYPRITAEQSLVNIEDSSTQAREILAGLDEKIGHRLQEAMSQAADTMKESISSSLREVLAPAVEKLVDNAHQGSEKALDGLMNEFMSKVGLAGEEQQKALLGTASAVQSASSEINRGVEELLERLNAFLAEQQAFTQSFEGIVRANELISSDLKSASDNLKDGAESLSQHTQSFAASSQELGESVNSAAARLSEATSAISQINESQRSAISQLQEVYESIGELDRRLKGITGEASADMRAVQENTAAVLEVLRQQMEAFDGRMAVFADRQNEALERTTETVARASSGVSGQVDSLLEKVSVTLQSNLDSAETFRGIAAANSQAADKLTSVAVALSASADNLAGHNAGIAQASNLLADAASAASVRIQDASKAMSLISDSQHGATTELGQLTRHMQELSTQMATVGERADQGLTRVNQHFDKVSDSMKQHITELETQLAKLLTDYSNQVQTQTVDRLNVWNTQTQEYVGAMSDAVQALAGVVDEIERGQQASGRAR